MRVAPVAIFAGAVLAGSATTCGPARIVTQDDADAINSCATITGDVVLATNAVSKIVLNGIETIQGRLTSEECVANTTTGQVTPDLPSLYSPDELKSNYDDHNCSGPTELSAPFLTSVADRLNLSNLPSLTAVAFPSLATVGGELVLYGLPSLQNLSLPLLASAGSFRLAWANQLRSLSLPKIQRVGSTFEVRAVGLTASFIELGVDGYIPSVFIGGVPGLRSLQLYGGQIDSLEIQGDGFLNFQYMSAQAKIQTLRASGCRYLGIPDIIIDSVFLNGNTFSKLNLANIHRLHRVQIQNNPQLTSVSLPPHSYALDDQGEAWQSIEITENPLLNSTNITTGIGATTLNVSSMVFSGAFDNSWFSRQFRVNTVLGQTIVNSTDPTFDCSVLDAMHSNGTLGGLYTCQGKTVYPGGTKSLARLRLAPSLVMICVQAIVLLLWGGAF